MTKRIYIGGIEVKEVSLGGRMGYMPIDPMGMLRKVLSGEANLEDIANRRVTVVEDAVISEDALDEAFDEGYEEGWDEGYDEGHEEGVREGVEEGEERGYVDGYNAGYKEGFNDGVLKASEGESYEAEDVRQDEAFPTKAGYTLRQYRENEGMSRTQMAEYMGISRRSLGRYEDDNRLAADFGL